MRICSKAVTVACLAVIIIPLALTPSCSIGGEPADNQTKSEQNLSEGGVRAGRVLESLFEAFGGALRRGTGSDAVDDFESLTVGSSEGFALWVRGRLALSSGADEDELLFEVDPESERVRMWASLAVDGAVAVAGSFAARGATIVGAVHAGALEVSEATVDSIRAGTVESSQMLADEMESGSIEGNTILGRLVSATELAVSSGRLERLEALNATVSDVVATTMSAESLSGQSLEAADVRAGWIGSTAVEAEMLSAADLSGSALTAATASIGELVATMARIDEAAFDCMEGALAVIERLTATSIDAATVKTALLEADEVSAVTVQAGAVRASQLEGPLATLRPGVGFAGVAVLPAGALACEIETDPRVDGVVVTPAGAGGCACSWEVSELDAGRWTISRTFPPDAGGEIGESTVYWLAFELD